MFNKIALSWQMQYEMRWCIKQHSHLFYYTRDEEEIYCGVITYLNHFLYRQSCQRGRWGRYPWGRQNRQARGWACPSAFSGTFPWQTGLHHCSCHATRLSMFQGSISQGPWERRGMHVLEMNCCSQPWPFPGPSCNQSGFRWLVNIFKRVWNYGNQLPSFALLFKPFES